MFRVLGSCAEEVLTGTNWIGTAFLASQGITTNLKLQSIWHPGTHTEVSNNFLMFGVA